MLFKSIALFAALAVAQVHPPVGEPSGNAIIKPGLHEEVPKGEAYTITWEADTPNPVSILLVKGPSNNVVPIATLVENYANSGSFVWTPAESLESTGSEGYGLQIIDDVNGQYQWSTQFGLIGETVTPSGGYPTPTATVTASVTGGEDYPTVTASVTANITEGYPTKSVGTGSAPIYSTGYPISNSSIIVQPTKSLSVPSSLKTTASSEVEEPSSTPSGTSAFPPESTGAAAGLKAGLGLAGVVAFAAALL